MMGMVWSLVRCDSLRGQFMEEGWRSLSTERYVPVFGYDDEYMHYETNTLGYICE